MYLFQLSCLWNYSYAKLNLCALAIEKKLASELTLDTVIDIFASDNRKILLEQNM